MQAKDVIEKLKSQHKELLQVVNEFSTILDDVGSMDKAVKARAFLYKLGSLLDIHLKVEDKLLYPILIKSPNPKVQNTALAFANEMGDIAKNLGLYLEKWTTSVQIADGAEDFMKETKALVSVLFKRIDREDNELFPLLIATS